MSGWGWTMHPGRVSTGVGLSSSPGKGSFFKNFFKFYIGVSLINNVVLVSGVLQSASVTHIQVSIVFTGL